MKLYQGVKVRLAGQGSVYISHCVCVCEREGVCRPSTFGTALTHCVPGRGAGAWRSARALPLSRIVSVLQLFLVEHKN